DRTDTLRLSRVCLAGLFWALDCQVRADLLAATGGWEARIVRESPDNCHFEHCEKSIAWTTKDSSLRSE
ncbi:MAG: hypothetical protein Q8L68_03455, partial [Methylococcales bacterium]|nr:hypothetical protein [Methylococcales bacterium]